MWTITPEDVVGLSGQSITASQGTSSIIVDYVDTPTGLSATVYQGSISANNGADMLVGLASQSFSSTVGAISPADVVGLTGVEFKSGAVIDITLNGSSLQDPKVIVSPKGLESITHEIFTINNSNGLTVDKLSYNQSVGIVTCTLVTPILGFSTAPFFS